MSSNKPSKFDIWWNSAGVKRAVGAAYSLGAAVVIVGALFKIQHWQGAGLMLSIGMFTEAILFALGIFDRPHKEYEWDKVFAFEGEGVALSENQSLGGTTGASQNISAPVATTTVAAPRLESVPSPLAEEEMKTLSNGIKNLSETAQQLSSLTGSIHSTQNFVKNMESAADITAKFVESQTTLNTAASGLFSSYDKLNTSMSSIAVDTKEYADNVGNINKNLSSINSIYELQLKTIQSQNEALTQQAQGAGKLAESMEEIVSGNQQIKSATHAAVAEINKYKDASAQLASQIAELNQVYGNMLNALS